MHDADLFLFWSLFSGLAAFMLVLGAPLMGAILQVMHDLAVLTESPETYDKAVGILRRRARFYHAGYLLSVLTAAAMLFIALASGPAPSLLVGMGVSAGILALIGRRYDRRIGERSAYLIQRLDQGRQDLSLVQG